MVGAQTPVDEESAALAPAFAAARLICRRGAPALIAGTVFLPRMKRDAVCAIGAFFCMIRDAMHDTAATVQISGAGLRDYPAFVAPANLGSCGPGSDLDSRIGMLRDRLDEIYDRRFELPAWESRSEQQHALHAFAQTAVRCQVPRQHFLDYAESLRMDASIRRYATWTSLERYLQFGGGVIARAIATTLGLQHSDAARQLSQIGVAIGLTDILCNLKADAARGRVLLPLEDLARFRYTENELFAGTVNDAFRALMKFEIDRARALYRAGSEGICWLAGDGSRLAASLVAVKQCAILTAIESMDYDVIAAPVSPLRALGLASVARAWRLARRKAGQALPKVF